MTNEQLFAKIKRCVKSALDNLDRPLDEVLLMDVQIDLQAAFEATEDLRLRCNATNLAELLPVTYGGKTTSD